MSSSLGSVAEIVMGQAPAGDTYNDDGAGLPLIAGAGDFSGNGILAKKYTTKPTKIVGPGEIVLSIRASIGAHVRTEHEYCLGRGVAAIIPDETRLDGQYLWHWLESAQRSLAAKGRGATFLQVSKADIADLDIPLPSLPEQRRIADILDRADGLRAKRRRALSLLDELTARFVSQLGIDHEWPIRALQEVAATQGGLTVNRKRIGLPQEVDYLRVANVARGSIDLSEVKKIGITDAELERVSLRDGDLLVVEGHGNELEVGRTARWRGSGSMVHQNHLIRVRPYPGVLDSVYAEHFFNSQVARSYFRSVSKTTSGLNTINMSNVKGLPVQVPPFDVQLAFSEKAQQVDELRQLHRAELAKLDELFASLQHRAFRGEL